MMTTTTATSITNVMISMPKSYTNCICKLTQISYLFIISHNCNATGQCWTAAQCHS